VKVERVESIGLECFYDLFVPFYNNYLSKGGFVNHNSGKSHFFAELAVEWMVLDPDLRFVCIREVQKSLKFSAKQLIADKIAALGVSHLFDVLTTEIRRKNGSGVFIFQGMSSMNSDSIKSLEGFSGCWVEEAQNFSARSLALLRPTIRAPGSEIWFSWNPEQPDDAVNEFFRGEAGAPADSILVNPNYYDNPFLPQESYNEMMIDRARDVDYHAHVWLGGYNVKSDLQIFAGKWTIDEFVPSKNWDKYLGADWGFSQDPTVAIELYIHDDQVWIYRESWAIGLELDETADRWKRDIPGIENYVVRADSSRPESISYVRRHGIPRITGCEKWGGCVEDGIAFLRSFRQIVIHPQCRRMIEEARLYSYKANAAGDPLPIVVDKHNHCWDSVRGALAPLIKNQTGKREAPTAKAWERSPANLRKIF
jgi:phage terminase large subunit